MQTTTEIDFRAYIERLRSLTADMAIEDRFWIALSDHELRDMEDVLCESADRDDFYNVLTAEYQRWRDELSDDQWSDVLRRNREHGGANMNWLIEDIA